MLRCAGIWLLVLVTPVFARAQEAPEELLPAGTQVYFRWDGIPAHGAAFSKTALGKTLTGDTGTFLTGVVKQAQSQLGVLLTAGKLLQGLAPEKLQKLQADAGEAPKLLGQIGVGGIVVAAEMRRLEPPDGQLTVILPGAGVVPGPFVGSVRLLAQLAEVDLQEQMVAGTKVYTYAVGPVHVTAWTAGKYAVLSVGTDPPQATIQRTRAKDARLASHPLYQRLTAFHEFETTIRGFADFTTLVRNAKAKGKDAEALVEALGLDSLKSALFFTGFDGEALRSLIEVETAGPPKGLVAMLHGAPLTLADAPPIPPDVSDWSMSYVDLVGAYDLGFRVVELIARIVDPDSVAEVQQAANKIDEALGVKVRADLLAAVEHRLAVYNSPSEGLFGLGQALVFKVKDAQKLQRTLDKVFRTVGKGAVRIQKRPYHGAEIREIQINQQGLFFQPAYAIHKGWLIFSLFPQPIKGFILRANGETPAWQPDAHVKAALEKLPREFQYFEVSDPRPTIKQLLTIAPIVAGLLHSFVPASPIEVGAIPNATEATRHLFPNVTVVTAQGNVLRKESRSSLDLPFGMLGLSLFLASVGQIF